MKWKPIWPVQPAFQQGDWPSESYPRQTHIKKNVVFWGEAICNGLDQASLTDTWIHAFVTPRLNYCNGILYVIGSS